MTKLSEIEAIKDDDDERFRLIAQWHAERNLETVFDIMHHIEDLEARITALEGALVKIANSDYPLKEEYQSDGNYLGLLCRAEDTARAALVLAEDQAT